MSKEPAHVSITVHGPVGCGKTAIIFAILDALRSADIVCTWSDEHNEDGDAQDVYQIEHPPEVFIYETNPLMTGRSEG